MAGISKKRVKTKGGKEVIRYVITYRDVLKKQHTSGYYETLKEAKKDLGKFENIGPNIKNITYEKIFNTFLNKAREKYAESTLENYERYYKNYFQKFDNINYEKITSIVWQNIFDKIEKHSAHIAAAALKFAKAATNYAMNHNLVESNVFKKIETIKLPKADINHLTVEELKKVLKECKKSYPQYYVLLFTFISTGAREGEIFALNKDDFNYKEKSIRINKQFTKGKLKHKPKTSHSNRIVYIFDEAAEELKKHILTLSANNPLLFPNNAGNYHNASNFRERFWYKLLELCEINKRVRLHDLRGSYIDMTLAQGIPIKFTQNNVGHSRSSTTIDIYNQNSADIIDYAQDTLNAVFKKCEQNVSKKENSPNKKIIQFPKRCTGLMF